MIVMPHDDCDITSWLWCHKCPVNVVSASMENSRVLSDGDVYNATGSLTGRQSGVTVMSMLSRGTPRQRTTSLSITSTVAQCSSPRLPPRPWPWPQLPVHIGSTHTHTEAYTHTPTHTLKLKPAYSAAPSRFVYQVTLRVHFSVGKCLIN